MDVYERWTSTSDGRLRAMDVKAMLDAADGMPPPLPPTDDNEHHSAPVGAETLPRARGHPAGTGGMPWHAHLADDE